MSTSSSKIVSILSATLGSEALSIYIKELNKWIRLDARGNKENVHAEFSLYEERLAFPIRSQLGEVDYRDNNTDLDERLITVLKESKSILEVSADINMYE